MIEKLPFGRTDHLSTRTLFGAAAFWDVSQDEADAAMDILLQYGINHVDTAASYNKSEERLGSWIRRHGKPFFLATKTGERKGAEAMESLQRSLERLGVDSVDLIQLHHLAEPEEWEVAMGPGGALEALIEAREQGLVRFIGVTGHGMNIPFMHLRSLEQFDFDSVLLPFNYLLAQDNEYRQGFEAVLTECRRRNTAVQVIKSLARGPWGEREETRNVWYEPFIEQPDVDAALWWAMGVEGVFLNTSADIQLLPYLLDAASRFEKAPKDEEMRKLFGKDRVGNIF
ncbi:MAG: aldo/keto reductase [Chloroflexi bacterium]|nr:MAG: aldo/keto reductase [Chloroflexota bacterium]